ncbi:hypothetical protein PAXINDRAFT_130732 [Paxillus involutus ATCC 200175]|nr:hypothetical protein PAXINDRAFT_130732 [Paxillus involutus ATCC 200175]
MNWLANLFAGGDKQLLRRGQAMSNTHEAFSLPTTSPPFPSHPDAFNPDTLQTAHPLSPPYTYPPQSPISSYGYAQTSSGSRSRPASLLPLHHTPYTDAMTPPPPYPPLANTWNRLKLWLAREYPELGDTLNYGILPQDLAHIEMQFGFALPQAVRESYLVADGQEAESSAGCSEGLFFGLSLLPLEDVLEEWRFWREVDDDPATGANPRLRELMQSIPDGWVRKVYSQRGWIPLIVDKAGNYIGVDLNPGEGGSPGQVIVFGRDFDTKVVLWRGDGPGGWAKWLSSFVDELESGDGFELGQGNSESEGSDDGIGYGAYFYDGNGGGQADGGGEAGPGGLRLAGEYRGWSPLEAWADRSARKWHEAGLSRDVASPVEKGKAPEKRGLGVLNLDESPAVVPIPVFVDHLSEEPSALADITNVTSHPTVPAISVTKPPAPLPVDLPDVASLPSPPDSQRSSVDVDLEAGRGVGMQQLPDDDIVIGKSPAQPLTPVTRSVEARITDVSLVDDAIASYPAVEEVTDLLADSIPLEAVPPITLSTPTKPEPEPTSQETAEPGEPSLPSQPSEEGVLTQTVRLVGGGGSSGAEDLTPAVEDTEDVVVAEVPPVTSAESNGSPPKKGKTHDKGKSTSLSSLKRFSANLAGGKRKKDTVSNNKEIL